LADVYIHLRLQRATGVLAGIVAALARAGLELISQKIERDDDAPRGRLEIHADGQSPDPEDLAGLMQQTRGVERLTWLAIDGETVLSEPPALADAIGSEDLARLSEGTVDEAIAGGATIEGAKAGEVAVGSEAAPATGTGDDRTGFPNEPDARGEENTTLRGDDAEPGGADPGDDAFDTQDPRPAAADGADETDNARRLAAVRRRRRRRR